MVRDSQRGLSHPRSPEEHPAHVVMPQVLNPGTCVSSGRLPLAKTRPQCGMGGLQGFGGELSPAEERSCETTRNVGSLPRRPLPSQNPPGLSRTGCKSPRFGEGCLCLSQKTPTCKKGEAAWRERATGTHGDVEPCRGKKHRDCREC